MRHFFGVLTLALFSAAAGLSQAPVPLNQLPSRVVGHPQPEPVNPISVNPNLVEGRELFQPQGIALDTTITPPILYVADTGNNRVLGWRNATSFRNGQTADLVIGQTDLFRTGAAGGATTPSAGLSSPTGLAVYNGDLYIADNGNNRILRFRKPFNNIGSQFPDLHIGQPTLTGDRANYTGQVDRQGLSLNATTAYMAFDTTGNLWVTDPGNRRVLQFLASEVAAGGGPLRASLELGQLDFNTLQPAIAAGTRTKLDAFAIPSSIAFDSAGRLYVTDYAISGNVYTVSRVLVFNPPFANAMPATRVMGVFPATAPNQDAQDRTIMVGPEGMFFIPSAGKMGVADFGSSRILLFDTYDRWPEATTTLSPLATGVVGQPDFRNRGPNGGSGGYLSIASAGSLNRPTAVAFSGTELFVADGGNNRVVVLPFSGTTLSPATRVLGQDLFHGQSVNLIEGREFQFFSNDFDAGIVIDSTGETPHLYVADTHNHRILGFNDVRKVQAGVKADIVIGQADFTTALCNFQGLTNPDSGNPNRPTPSSLCLPTGLLVDSSGNLYVADRGNGRVLRFPAPFAHQGQLPQADLVLGQRNFTTKITDPTPSTMALPYGLAFAGSGGLLVSDAGHHRVLYFPFSSGGTFNAGTDNGKAATKVFGQTDFISLGSGNSDAAMSGPHHIATDNEAHLYVVDARNNRVLIFDQVTTNATPPTGAPAAKILLGFSSPRGIFVNQFTGELWVGDNNTSGQVRRYPRFATCLITCTSVGNVLSPTVLALTQDSFGNLAVADASSRVSFYFPGLQAINGASFFPNGRLAPGTFASLCSPGSNCLNGVAEFGGATADFNSLPNPVPYPKTLGDVQVLFNGQPTPLTYVSPAQINFIVPMSAPASGSADIVVVQESTGRIYAASSVNMNTYSPGIFTLDYGAPTRQAAVINLQDNTINTTTSCAARGSYISIYATGHGFIAEAPPDGALPQGLVRTPFGPRVWINSGYVDDLPLEAGEPARDQLIQYSGLSPQFPGVWQINVYIPKVVGPGLQAALFISAGGVTSTDFAQTGYRTTICIK